MTSSSALPVGRIYSMSHQRDEEPSNPGPGTLAACLSSPRFHSLKKAFMFGAYVLAVALILLLLSFENIGKVLSFLATRQNISTSTIVEILVRNLTEMPDQFHPRKLSVM